MSGFSIKGFLCDSARQEVDGKATIVGIWAGDIVVPNFPQLVACGAFARIEPLPSEVDVLMGIYFNDKAIVEFPGMRATDAPIAANGMDPSLFLVADRFILQLAEPGVVSLQITIGSEPRVLVSRVRVVQATAS